MKHAVRCWFFTWALLLAAPVRADDEALRRCRTLAEPAARLACYDQLPLAAASAPAQVPSRAPSPMPTAPPSAPAAVPPAGTFGLETRAADPAQIDSRIAGIFEGWGPRSRIRLANGQVWEVVDDSSVAVGLRDPRVTVRRAAMGTFRLEIEGLNHSPRVRRVE